LPFGFRLLDQTVRARGSLSAPTATRALGGAAFLHCGREHDERAVTLDEG
jgi:hypothetical protein